MLYAICFNLDQSKILSSGNGLNLGMVMLSSIILTKHSSNKTQWKLRSKEGEEPGSSIQGGGNLMGLKMVIELLIVIMD